ncbi:Uncharacterised protein [Helicobacter mustelae]|nr:Uncharacterised protein [Helicobacter mustelae]STP13112.1 Uncharacterised protein [Helicobacter mustelae]
MLLLFKNFRNRAFHFENLHKLNNCGKPRLSASVENKNKQKIIINLATENIEIFLDDGFKGLVEEALGRLGEKDPLETYNRAMQQNQV